MTLVAWLTPARLKLLLIALPLALAGVYYGLVAADRYVSESIVTVRQASESSAAMPGVAMLFAGATPPSRQDNLYLREYVRSLDMLKRIDRELGVRVHYEKDRLDWFYRLLPGSSQENFLEYYRSRIDVGYDDAASLLTLRVQGFDPGFAHALNTAILQESERFVNGLSKHMAREQLDFAHAELQRSGERLQHAKGQVLAFQTRHKLLDPVAQAQAAGALGAELQAALSRQEVELSTALGYLNEDAHQVKALRGQVAALRAQVAQERSRATSTMGNEKLNEIASRFQDLALQAQFSQEAYKLTLTAAENARIEASRKLKSLVVIEPPSIPETALYPRRLYNFATLLVGCLLLYGIGRLVVATIREHQD